MMKERARAPRSKSFRRMVRHPVTGKQFWVRAQTAAKLEQRLRVIRDIRDAYQTGAITEEEADDRIRRMKHGRVTLARAAELYIIRPGISDNTRRDARSFLRAAGAPLAPLDLRALDVPVVSAWIDSLRGSKYPSSTISCYWRRLRSIVLCAIERGILGRFPWGPWRPKVPSHEPAKERESARTYDELVRLLYAARLLDRQESYARELEAKTATMIALGLRQGELAGLRWPDLHSDACVVVIARQYTGAPTKTRHAPKRLSADRELFILLERYRLRLVRRGHYVGDGPVFPRQVRSAVEAFPPRSQVLTTSSLRAVVRLAGLPNPEAWSPRSLRDSFATLESMAHGGDWKAVQSRTRHRSLTALARYLRAIRRGTLPAGFALPASAESTPRLPDPSRS